MTLNALTVDLEEYFQVSNFDHVIDRGTWNGLPSRVGASTERLLDLFDRHDCRATFFVLGWVAERHPALIRQIRDRGHEIACHGHAHELVYQIGIDRFREDLTRARSAIEQATGEAVTGYRAPSYSITERSLWALDVLADQGFGYDSSIFPIRHHRYGIPGFTRRPVRIALTGGRSIIEFPLTTARIGRFVLPLAGGAYLRFFPEALFRWGFRRQERQGLASVLYLHPWEIDAEQPVQDVSLRVRINHYYNLARTETKLGRLLGRFRFGTVRSVLAELDRREQLPASDLASALIDRLPPTIRRTEVAHPGSA